MSTLIPFTFDGATVRVNDRDGGPWFVIADVCRVLEIGNPSDAARRLDDDEKGVDTVDTPGGIQEMVVVNESGLWSLVLTSRKPAAKRFKKWVTAEVLPTIRKTGGYGTAAPDLSNPDTLLPLLAQYAEDKKRLMVQVEEMRPAVAALDRLSTPTAGAMCIMDTAKDLQVKPRTLTRFLEQNRWVYRRAGGKRRMVAYQNRIEAGLLEHKTTEVDDGEGGTKFVDQVLVTPKGRATLAKLLSTGEA